MPSKAFSRPRVRSTTAALFVGAAVVAATCVATAPAAPAQAATGITANLAWSQDFGIAGKPVALASPMVATLDGRGTAVLIGDRAGYERAFRLASGANVNGWPLATGAAIDSTPSVLNSGSTKARIFWGEGNSGAPAVGGLRAVSAGGSTIWNLKLKSTPAGGTAGIMSSASIGNLQSGADVVAGAMGQEQYMAYSTGTVGGGFPWFQADTNFSTPALADPLKTGHDEIIEGGDSTAGNAYGVQYSNGGHIRILGNKGNYNTGSPSGGLRCQYNTTQVVQSSPAVGHFLANGAFGIAVGTGTYWGGASDTNKVIAIDNSCHPIWKASLSGNTQSSPALSNLTGTGQLYVVQGTSDSQTSGHVYALNGKTGAALWVHAVPGQVLGGITTADLLGDGNQEVVVPTTNGTYILNGKTGAQITEIGQGYGFQNSALITKEADGSTGITLAGYTGLNHGAILHYKIAGSNGSKVMEAGAWPMFHHDQHLSGSADAALPVNP